MVDEQDERAALRQNLKDLIDGLPERDLYAVKRYIQFLHYVDDPVAMSLAEAPLDDEPLTDEDIAALAEAEEDIKAGRLIPAEEVYRELGLRGGG